MKIITFIFVIIIFSSCNFSNEKRVLSGGCCFYSDGRPNDVIAINKDCFIPCQIIKYGYNNDFIIAAQNPQKDCFLGKDSFTYKEGKDRTYFWLVIHQQKLLLGPLNEKEFNDAKIKYHVPISLELKPVN